MTKWAETVEPFDGVPDGEVQPRRFQPGDPVFGELAEVAIKQKWAKPGKGEPPAAPEPEPQEQQPASKPDGQAAKQLARLEQELKAANDRQDSLFLENGLLRDMLLGKGVTEKEINAELKKAGIEVK